MSGLVMPQGGLIVPMGAKKKFEFNDRAAHAAEIMSKLGPLDDIDVNYGLCLVALYIRDDIGTGLLQAAPQTQLEDRWQSKVGLLLKKGPLAFRNRPDADFGGADPEVGSYVVYRSSDGSQVDLVCLDGLSVVHCKYIEDAECKGKVKFPDRVW